MHQRRWSGWTELVVESLVGLKHTKPAGFGVKFCLFSESRFRRRGAAGYQTGLTGRAVLLPTST